MILQRASNLLMTVVSDLTSSDLYLDVDKNNPATNSRFSAYPYDWIRAWLLVSMFRQFPNRRRGQC